MQNENNNSRNWKKKLENIESFPADMRVKKDVAWNKLNAKLQHQPKRRKAFPYWAAACLLPLLLIPILHRNRSSIVTNITRGKATITPLIKETIPAQKEVIIVKAIAPEIQKKKGAKKPEISSNINHENQEQTPQINNDSIGQKLAAINVIQSDSNTAKETALIPLAKKLKIVHINELNEPVEATPMLVHSMSEHPFPFQIARGEVHGNDVKAIHTTSFISFKTKPLTN